MTGPVGAALGNALVQARAGGVSGGLTELRALLRATQNVRIYRPSTSDDRAWAAAAERVGLT